MSWESTRVPYLRQSGLDGFPRFCPYLQCYTALYAAYNRTVTGHFAYETFRLLDYSLPTGFHVVYALIQLYNVQQELRDHY